MTKWKGKVASLAPTLFAASISSTALMAGDALAQSITTTTTAPVVSTTDQDLSVTSTGSIAVDPLSATALVDINVADYTSTLRNDGSMTGTNITGGSHTAINIQNTLSGQVINNNQLEISTVGTINDLLRGIEVGSNNGVIENNGDILIDLTGSLLGQARGIETTIIEGSLINRGEIDVKVDAVSAVSTGVETGIITGNFENSGLISSVATGSSATAYGAEMSFLFGSASNSGTISVMATASSEASALGIRVVNPVFGSLDNSGTIAVEAQAGTNPNATGLNIDSIFSTGTVANTGTVSVKAIGTGISATSGYAIGIANNNNSGGLSNSGVIDVFVDGVGTAFAAGINLSILNTDGSLSNSGSITVHSSGKTRASAFGLNLPNINSSLSNSGTIEALAQGDTALAKGIVGNSVGAGLSLLNSGTIAATGTGTGTFRPVVRGLELDSLSGTIDNSGTIQATGNGLSGASVAGIEVRNIAGTGTLTSSGTISARVIGTGGASASGIAFGINNNINSGSVSNSGVIDVFIDGVNFASAAGVNLGALETGNSLSNSGSITVRSTGITAAAALGLNLSDINGPLSNSGTVDVMAQGDTAFAIAIQGSTVGADASIHNSGTISASGTGNSGAIVLGLELGNLSGTLGNSGTIQASGNGLAGASVTAIAVQSIAGTGTLANSGTISAWTIGTGGTSASGYAYGISNFINSGSVSNSGVIDVFIEGVDYASGAGIGLGALDAGRSLSNSGSITVKSTGVTSAYAFGLNLSNEFSPLPSHIDGSLSNSGTIDVLAQGDRAFAMAVLGSTVGTDGSIHNSGKITSSGIGTTGLTVRGIQIQSLSGAIGNSGAIEAVGIGQTGGLVTGIAVTTAAGSGSLTNSGTIDVTAHFDNAEMFSAAGIGAGLFDGTLLNSGNILVRSTALPASSATSANVYGIAMSIASNELAHSGTITVESAGGTNSQAFGIFVGNFSGTLDVTGDINVSGATENYGIFLGNGGGTLNIDTTADINQLIRVSDHDVNLVHVGPANIYRFEDADTSAGFFTTQVNVPNSAWFVKDEGGAYPVYATTSGSDFQLNTLVPFQIGDLNDVLTRQVEASGKASKFDQAAYAFNGTPTIQRELSPYVSATYSRSRQSASSEDSSSDSNLNSLNAGVTHDLGGGTRYGVGLSYAKGIAKQSPNTLDTTGGFISGVLAQEVGLFDLSAGAGAGWFSHTNHRQVEGSTDAVGDLSSTVVTGQLGISTDISLPGNLIFTPEALVRVGQQRFSSYTETGTDADATVASRTVTFSQVNVGATLAAQIGPGILSASAAAVRRDIDGPSTVDLTIFDTSATLVSEVGRSDTFGEFRLGYELPVGSNGALSLNAQTGIGADSMTQAFSAFYKLTF